MNSELKRKWVAALRSGKYKQGSGKLRSHDDHFCCLGVLADVIDSEAWTRIDNTYAWQRGDLDWVCSLPEGCTDLRTNASYDLQLVLMGLNGSAQLSFDKIADWIEAHISAEE